MSIEELAARQRAGVVPLSVRRADAQSATRDEAVLATVYDHIGIGVVSQAGHPLYFCNRVSRSGNARPRGACRSAGLAAQALHDVVSGGDDPAGARGIGVGESLKFAHRCVAEPC
jgi:hypothetical protein